MKITIENASGSIEETNISITHAYNFGFAGRDAAEAQAHVEELAELGFPAPSVIPAIYPINADLVQVADSVLVRGPHTYGEVEFAILHTAEGVLITIASDHSDANIETVSTAQAKTVYPDVIGSTAWRLSDLDGHWDKLTLTCERLGDDGWTTVQQGSVASLLTPHQLTDVLRERSSDEVAAGTVLLSGTIGGEIVPAARVWRNTLTDPVLDRSLVIEYRVQEQPLEI